MTKTETSIRVDYACGSCDHRWQATYGPGSRSATDIVVARCGYCGCLTQHLPQPDAQPGHEQDPGECELEVYKVETYEDVQARLASAS